MSENGRPVQIFHYYRVNHRFSVFPPGGRGSIRRWFLSGSGRGGLGRLCRSTAVTTAGPWAPGRAGPSELLRPPNRPRPADRWTGGAAERRRRRRMNEVEMRCIVIRRSWRRPRGKIVARSFARWFAQVEFCRCAAQKSRTDGPTAEVQRSRSKDRAFGGRRAPTFIFVHVHYAVGRIRLSGRRIWSVFNQFGAKSPSRLLAGFRVNGAARLRITSSAAFIIRLLLYDIFVANHHRSRAIYLPFHSVDQRLRRHQKLLAEEIHQRYMTVIARLNVIDIS